ncbi:MAG: hypothetical protein QOF39_1102 [Frankiales bacterium]|jgi:hypothetical protein|nr:hypothetical protein [Frankiales bacterium]
MGLAVYLPLMVAAVFGLTGPPIARRLRPGAATWLLGVGGFLTSAAAGVSLCLLGFTLLAQAPVLAAQGHWSDGVLRRHDPVTTPVAALALIAAVALLARVAVTAVRRVQAVREAHRLADALPTHGGELAVINTPDVAAYAIPGRPGRIVATTGLLRRLDGAERRAMLAHERAHLSGHHHLHQAAALLAAAGNPLLRRLPAATAAACERWADEKAASTYQRHTLADALTQAGTGTRLTVPAVVLPGVQDVAARIEALRAPAPPASPWRVVLLGGLVACAGIALAIALKDAERLFELARQADRLRTP